MATACFSALLRMRLSGSTTGWSHVAAGGDISNGNSVLQRAAENEAVGIDNGLKPRCCGESPL
jgi:hypothetical protein